MSVMNGTMPVIPGSYSQPPAGAASSALAGEPFAQTLQDKLQNADDLADLVAPGKPTSNAPPSGDGAPDAEALKAMLRDLLKNKQTEAGDPLTPQQLEQLQQIYQQLLDGKLPMLPPEHSLSELIPELRLTAQPAPSTSTSAPLSAELNVAGALSGASTPAIPPVTLGMLAKKERHDDAALPLTPRAPAVSTEATQRSAPLSAQTLFSAALPAQGAFTADRAGNAVDPLAALNAAADVPSAALASSLPGTTTTAQPAALSAVPSLPLSTPVQASEWPMALSQHIALFLKRDVQRAELRLNPQELGTLQISMKLSNDQAQIHFVAEHQQVRAAIEATLPHLRTSLAEAGLELSQSYISADLAGGQHGGAFADTPAEPGAPAAESAAPLQLDDTQHQQLTQLIRRSNGIDTFA